MEEIAGGAEGFLRTAGNVDMRVSEAIASAAGSGVGGMAFGALIPPGLGVGKIGGTIFPWQQ